MTTITEPTLTANDTAVLAAILERLHGQDARYGKNWPADRDGIRLALATIEDEHLEAYDEWRLHKKTGDWTTVTYELLDVAAVVFRALRTLVDSDEQAGQVKS